MKFQTIDECGEKISINDFIEDLKECVDDRVHCEGYYGGICVQFKLGSLLFDAPIPDINTPKQLQRLIDTLNHLKSFEEMKK